MGDKKKVKLKLLINKEEQKVVFAEANKDFVDFLFSLLRLPLGDAVRLLSSTNSVTGWSTPNIYRSIENLDDSYLNTGVTKSSLLSLGAPVPTIAAASHLLLPDGAFSPPPPPVPRTIYICNHPGSAYSPITYYASTSANTKCPSCNKHISTSAQFVGEAKPTSGGSEGGYTRDMVTYMVMDDLTVTPATMISTIEVLNAANVKEFEALESRNVQFGVDEGLKLLEASLCSTSALTYVFLGKKQEVDKSNGDGECAVEASWINAEMVKKLKE